MTHGAIGLFLDQSDLRGIGATPPHLVPVSDVDLVVNGNPDVIGYVVFPHFQDVVQLAAPLSMPSRLPSTETTTR